MQAGSFYNLSPQGQHIAFAQPMLGMQPYANISKHALHFIRECQMDVILALSKPVTNTSILSNAASRGVRAGVVVCSQCEGHGVNTVDDFSGRFKEGAICWLCRGKKDMLCGDCNGAGFTVKLPELCICKY